MVSETGLLVGMDGVSTDLKKGLLVGMGWVVYASWSVVGSASNPLHAVLVTITGAVGVSVACAATVSDGVAVVVNVAVAKPVLVAVVVTIVVAVGVRRCRYR